MQKPHNPQKLVTTNFYDFTVDDLAALIVVIHCNVITC